MAKIKLMIADHHSLVLEGLKALLEKESDIRVAAEAADGDEMMKKLKETGPDVLLMDISMPGLAGVESIRRIKEAAPGANVVILTVHSAQSYIREALHSGATGYLLKTSPFAEVLGAIRSASQNRYFLSTEINADIIHSYLHNEEQQEDVTGYDRLTRREQEIFKMIAEGATANEIARKTAISPKTVAKHRTNLMEKLKMKNTAALVHYALQLGVVDPENDSGRP